MPWGEGAEGGFSESFLEVFCSGEFLELTKGSEAGPAHCPRASSSHAPEMPGANLFVRFPERSHPPRSPGSPELSAPHLHVTSDLPSLIPNA